MAEGAPLLREYTLIAYRGFESLLLRHLIKSASLVEALSFGALTKSDENRGFDQIRLKEYLAPSRLSDEARGSEQPFNARDACLQGAVPVRRVRLVSLTFVSLSE